MCQLLLLHCLRISGVLVSVYMVSLPINYHYFRFYYYQYLQERKNKNLNRGRSGEEQ